MHGRIFDSNTITATYESEAAFARAAAGDWHAEEDTSTAAILAAAAAAAAVGAGAAGGSAAGGAAGQGVGPSSSGSLGMGAAAAAAAAGLLPGAAPSQAVLPMGGITGAPIVLHF